MFLMYYVRLNNHAHFLGGSKRRAFKLGELKVLPLVFVRSMILTLVC